MDKKSEYDGVIRRMESVRKRLELSQREFCRRMDYPIGNYSNVIGGRKTKPAIDLMMKVTRRYNVQYSWLLDGRGDWIGY